jgi:hypothetical protein
MPAVHAMGSMREYPVKYKAFATQTPTKMTSSGVVDGGNLR